MNVETGGVAPVGWGNAMRCQRRRPNERQRKIADCDCACACGTRVEAAIFNKSFERRQRCVGYKRSTDQPFNSLVRSFSPCLVKTIFYFPLIRFSFRVSAFLACHGFIYIILYLCLFIYVYIFIFIYVYIFIFITLQSQKIRRWQRSRHIRTESNKHSFTDVNLRRYVNLLQLHWISCWIMYQYVLRTKSWPHLHYLSSG